MTPSTNGAVVAANPHGDGPQHSFRSYGTWHGICGSNGMESFTMPRMLKILHSMAELDNEICA
jgi:hypothetical protein